MKRKNDTAANGAPAAKKRAMSDDDAHASFRKGLFDSEFLEKYRSTYAKSQPYLHGVIPDLINEDLLRKVRTEIQENISFKSKETDIYKIDQSGDLANLDGLDDKSLKLLPSLLTLRDALYSSAFRTYISTVAGSGPLSGIKTDMAVNVYTPGCHLLCHDDVIGSRRVSYILYLLDPDKPWKPEWGGALRLYPTESFTSADGTEVKVPQANFTVSIPPAFNQLSFFTVQPGESFHDVEEVYHRGPGDNENDGGRVRMAISGWFHIPQKGEVGYEEGLEEKLADRSSLQQLQGKSDEFDLPEAQWHEYDVESEEIDPEAEKILTATEVDFLLEFITPNYLTPDTVDQITERFEEEASVKLAGVLSKKFFESLHDYLQTEESKGDNIPGPHNGSGVVSVARPPHKHRFLYRHPTWSAELNGELTPYDRLVDILFPSLAFRKWLAFLTGLPLTNANILARRFRRGKDYSLATSYEEDEPQLEVCLGITPTRGWGDDEGEDEESGANSALQPATESNGTAHASIGHHDASEESVGGYEIYMAADEDEDDGSDDGVEIPAGASKGQSSATGGGKRRNVDPAVYRSGGADEDEGVLFSSTAGWNTLNIVLRDKGVLRFVKYVSKRAKGDRWDVCGNWQVLDEEEEENQAQAQHSDELDEEDVGEDDEDDTSD